MPRHMSASRIIGRIGFTKFRFVEKADFTYKKYNVTESISVTNGMVLHTLLINSHPIV